ncbi:LuxR C-terminal-related transcriptional regulator [Vibrio splendidus]|uniref:response regulator transcription factor n=1 Tax=Vibrio splendidus TaxID=29497 RepID=UPI00246903E0|nr:LuxR C-terminal-related transcriptional regulator [Vibrio splendidus]MDH5911487.1 LuxR C-terminal-related transcriptional regulator [Vibrio splendidus]MDH5942728.1 LuxR C-terminal-related transcriptional regulator [Vibrio splendidus]MDH5985725.1 LuxR C-terminal-related transcriptional regulator [Vibrio splendidus]MDH5994305.1 LuxR C-terminal-related transcriptional regulator [Vibrio splendidus]MDH6005152.1 LuxR C-terminal-related transcriptional regulator [Vibrio splendidus]
MSNHRAFIESEFNHLISCNSDDIMHEIQKSVSRTVKMFDIERISIFPISKLKITTNEFISSSKSHNKKIIATIYMGLDHGAIEKYLKEFHSIDKFKHFNEDEMRNTENKLLKMIHKEGMTFHYKIPILIFGELYGGVGVSTTSPIDETMIDDIRTIGNMWVLIRRSSLLANKKSDNQEVLSHEQSKIEELTKRQLQILRMVGSEKPSSIISETLHLSIRTIESHKYRISSKLGLQKEDSLEKFCKRNSIWE